MSRFNAPQSTTHAADCRVDAEGRSEVTMLSRLSALNLIDKHDVFPNLGHKCAHSSCKRHLESGSHLCLSCKDRTKTTCLECVD